MAIYYGSPLRGNLSLIQHGFLLPQSWSPDSENLKYTLKNNTLYSRDTVALARTWLLKKHRAFQDGWGHSKSYLFKDYSVRKLRCFMTFLEIKQLGQITIQTQALDQKYLASDALPYK